MAGKLIAEMIGTFFLVLTVGLTVMEPDAAGDFAPLAIGVSLMVMVYATGHVSGGHLNPAVTLGVTLRGKLPWFEVVPYWVAQCLGAIGAAFVVMYLKGETSKPPEPGAHLAAKFLAEFLFTFALVYVVLNSATAKGTAGNSFYGLAIGLTVTAGAYAIGPISGAALNPAVAVGATTMGLSPIPDIWVFVASELAAGAAAALVFKVFDMGGDRAAV